MALILVVDDEPNVRIALGELLQHHGHTVVLADSGETAIELYGKRPPELLILDLTLPGISGVETLARIRERDPKATAIFLTAFASIRSAVEAMRVGGFDFLAKPFDNDELVLVVDRALEFQRLDRRVKRLEEDLETRTTFSGFVGRSTGIQELLRTLAKVARIDATVLLLGESGTGKELAATSLHRQSLRSNRPFVAVNCAAIPSTLAESELFGHERGAFTDARESRVGRFEQANGGTLFLDEIGELELDTQAKLLRVLQEREVTRLGGRQPIPVDVRLVAATNRDLELAIKADKFRGDLYWRLNAFPVRLPTLRDRRDDVPLLVNHFLSRLNERLGLNIGGVSAEAVDRLMAYSWPGNVRELENTLLRAMILTEHDTIQASDLPPNILARQALPSDVEPSLPGTMDEIVARSTDRIERVLIENTLAQCRGNRTKAAAILGVTRRTLFNKMKRFRLTNESAELDESD